MAILRLGSLQKDPKALPGLDSLVKQGRINDLQANLAATGMSALEHYVRFGRTEGRRGFEFLQTAINAVHSITGQAIDMEDLVGSNLGAA
jgi:hypothetical protein